MKIALRLVWVFLILLTVAISFFTFICSVGLVSKEKFDALAFTFYGDLGIRSFVAIACIFIILLSIFGLFLRSRNNEERSTKIVTSRNGSVKISYRAISEMIKSLVLDVEKVLKANVSTSKEADGIDVMIILSLSGSANMRETTEKIKGVVDEFLSERCGVKVYDIDVLIDRIVKKNI